ncbi:hypothetical protein [Microbacterium sp.]|uniref:hypothetical protein n=1 Tax=Microbacterium sp. TaxID=51671 RepID=UPI003F6EE5A8
MDARDLERLTEDVEPRERDDGVGEELEDRRRVETAIVRFGSSGDQARSFSKQRWLQLRGNGRNRCDDGR